jgi:hypothetical protein
MKKLKQRENDFVTYFSKTKKHKIYKSTMRLSINDKKNAINNIMWLALNYNLMILTETNIKFYNKTYLTF